MLTTIALVLGGTAILGGLKDTAADIARGIAQLFGWIVEIIGRLFFYVGDSLARLAIDMNLELPASRVIPLGLETTIPLANLAIIVGLIIIAFAIMTRAEWITTAREALPKLLTAILLVNFTYFALVSGLIQGVDRVTERFYLAARYNPETFQSVFVPEFDLTDIMQIRLAINEHPEQGAAFQRYFEMQAEIGSGVWQELQKLNETLPPNVTVTKAQEYAVLNRTTEGIGLWLGDPYIQDGGSWWSNIKGLVVDVSTGIGVALLFGSGLGIVGTLIVGGATTLFLSTSNIRDAYRNTLDAMHPDWRVKNEKGGDLVENAILAGLAAGNISYPVGSENEAYQLETKTGTYVDNVLKITKTAVLKHFQCDINADPDVQPGCRGEKTDSVAQVAAWIYRPLDNVEKTIVVFANVLFKTVWIFIGTLTLFGLASMFFIRYITLSILVILFPIVWFGWIFPKIISAGGGKNIWTAWWSQFMRWLLFGPIAMFFIFLAIKTATLLSTENPLTALTIQSTGGAMAIMASAIGDMFVIIGMLIGGLYTANKMGIAGSKIFYGSMIKARSWVGKQVKKGALALPKKYGKMGLEKAKDVAKAQKLSFTSDRLQTDKAQQRTKDLAASKSRLARFAGRRRMGKSQAAQSFLKDREKQRLFMHKDAKGEWKDNAPYLNSQIVAGLLKDPEANENALAVAYELMGEGKILPFETDAQGLLAYAANSPGFIDRHNLQKAENALAKIGYSNAAMAVVASGGDRAGVRAALNKKLGPRSVVRFDPDTQNAPNKETAGQTLAQKRVYLNGVNDFLTIDRSDQLAQNFGTFDGERKMDVLKASSEVVEEMGGLMGGVIQGFSGLTPEQQMQHFDGLTALNLSNIRAAATSGSALHEAIRGVDTSSAEGQAQLRRTLRTIYSNNSNLIGNTSTLGAYLGGIPPAPSP